ncbi:MAG: prepilin-type N-terminal cleavage/methylation domain-containing protein [Pseudomonadota bacterium]
MRTNGFSLIEMAVVLFIVSLLIGHLLTPISAQIDQRRYKQTQKTLEEIKEALLGFISIHGRLPYPASNQETGIQDSSLHKKEGYLAWADLGIARVDAWGNPFRYRAEDEYTKEPLDYKKIFGIAGSGSGLRVTDKQDRYLTRSSGDSRVAAIIFSYGKNGVPDDDNGNRDKIFVYDVYVENDFDDILTWLSRNTLVNRLYATGRLPP